MVLITRCDNTDERLVPNEKAELAGNADGRRAGIPRMPMGTVEPGLWGGFEAPNDARIRLRRSRLYTKNPRRGRSGVVVWSIQVSGDESDQLFIPERSTSRRISGSASRLMLRASLLQV
jgi:hypothetical protein